MDAQPVHEIRLLIVDDNAAFVGALRGLLESWAALRVAGAVASAEDALVEVPRLQPDIVLIGVRTSQMAELDWVNRIKAAENAPLLVVLSLGDSPAYQAAAAAHGADGFVPKEAVDRMLLPLIRELLDRPRARA